MRVLLAALCFLLVMPAVAAANDYCVNRPSCVSGGGVDEGSDAAAVQKALDDAAARTGADRVLVGPGTYTRTGTGAGAAFKYQGDALTLEGAGAGQTTLTRDVVDNSFVLGVDATTIVTDLGVAVPGGTFMYGLGLGGGTASRIKATVPSGVQATAVKLSGGSADHLDISGDNATGIELISSGTVTDSTVSARTPVSSQLGAFVERCRLKVLGTGSGVEAYNGIATVADTAIDLGGGGGRGAAAFANGNGDASVVLRHSTIAHGGVGSSGVFVSGLGGKTASTSVYETVINGVAAPLAQFASGAGSKATAGADWSAFDPSGDTQTANSGAAVPSAPTVQHLIMSAPGFVDPAADLHLRWDSPLIDAANPAAPAAGESVTDLDGNPRTVGGRRDVGAYEYQRRAPTATATGPASATVGTAVDFSGTAADPDPGDTVTGQWTFDDGGVVPAGSTASHAFATAGTHTATFTASDPTGLHAAAAVAVDVQTAPVITVSPSPAPSAAPSASPSPSVSPTPTPGPAVGCIVPKLKGRTLAAARRALVHAHCALGKVVRPHKHRRLRVRSQTRKAGIGLPAGSRVGVTLRHKRRGH